MMQFRELESFVRPEWNTFGRLSAETGFGSHPDHKLFCPPSSTILDAHSTVSAGARDGSVKLGWNARCTRVLSSNFEHSALKNESLT